MCFFRLWLVGGLQLISAWLGGALVLQCSSLGGARLWVPGGYWRGRRVRLCCAHLLQVHAYLNSQIELKLQSRPPWAS